MEGGACGCGSGASGVIMGAVMGAMLGVGMGDGGATWRGGRGVTEGGREGVNNKTLTHRYS